MHTCAVELKIIINSLSLTLSLSCVFSLSFLSKFSLSFILSLTFLIIGDNKIVELVGFYTIKCANFKCEGQTCVFFFKKLKEQWSYIIQGICTVTFKMNAIQSNLWVTLR